MMRRPEPDGEDIMTRTSLILVMALAGTLVGMAGAARAEPASEIVIEAGSVEPAVLRTITGKRVDFVNRAHAPVHVQFLDDKARHDLVQVPAVGPMWAVFHRPGTHPYVVHVGLGPNVRSLRGLVEAVEDADASVLSRTCGFTVMDVCFEP